MGKKVIIEHIRKTKKDEQLETRLTNPPYLVTHKQVDAVSTIANTVPRIKLF